MKLFSKFILVLTLFTAFSCSKDSTPSQSEIDKQFNTDIGLIEEYLKANNLTATKTPQGVYYIIEEPGGETKPKITSTIVINYKGYFLDNSSFDAGNSAQIGLSNVIQGWQIGIIKFGKGGKGKLLIPSKYAYGSSGSLKIGPNKVLIFDIELLDIK
jgi:FKBP-type peptidyl-prolyl cis-trans isomerase FkpA